MTDNTTDLSLAEPKTVNTVQKRIAFLVPIDKEGNEEEAMPVAVNATNVDLADEALGSTSLKTSWDALTSGATYRATSAEITSMFNANRK